MIITIIVMSAIMYIQYINKEPNVAKNFIPLVLVVLGFGIIGFIDDFIKVVLKRNLGLRAWQKIVLQLIIFGLFMYYICCVKQMPTSILVPFTNNFIESIKKCNYSNCNNCCNYIYNQSPNHVAL
mgnify:CR=1 FL=1